MGVEVISDKSKDASVNVMKMRVLSNANCRKIWCAWYSSQTMGLILCGVCLGMLFPLLWLVWWMMICVINEICILLFRNKAAVANLTERLEKVGFGSSPFCFTNFSYTTDVKNVCSLITFIPRTCTWGCCWFFVIFFFRESLNMSVKTSLEITEVFKKYLNKLNWAKAG